jgi:hypothetical protein
MNINLNIDTEKINRGFVDIEKASNRAAKNTLNIVAAISRRNYVKNVKDNLILRNNFTTRNIQYEKTETEDISQMETRVGARDRAEYMDPLEKGGKRRSKRGSALAIPQLFARGGSNRRLVTRQNYLRKLKSKKVKGKFKKKFRSKKAMGVARAAVAYREKKVLRYSDNIFLIASFKKNKSRIQFKKKHLYNLSQRTAKIKSRKMLLPAIEKPVHDSQNIYNSQMKKLLKSTEII